MELLNKNEFVLSKNDFVLNNNKLSNDLLTLLIVINFIIHSYLYKKIQKINKTQAFNYSYNIHSFFCYSASTCLSYYAYYSGEMNYLSYSVETRVFGSCSALKNVCYVFLSYNIYSTFISIYLKKWLMCAHHIGAISIIYYNFNIQLFHYYLLFYGGATCFSSVILCVIDTFKNNNDLIYKYPKIYTILRFLFTISFIYLRLFLWNIYNLTVYPDILYIYRAKEYQHLQNNMIIYFLIITLFTILQIYWVYKIICGCLKYLKKEN